MPVWIVGASLEGGGGARSDGIDVFGRKLKIQA